MRGKQEHSGTVLIDGKNENLQECFLSYRRLSLAGDPLDLLPAVGTKPAVRALPELPAALAEGGIKLLIYGLPVLLLVKGRKSELVSPPEKWLQMNRETIFVGLGGGAFFLLFFLLTNFLKNPAQGVALQSPSVGEILSTVVFAGVTEELFFRGLLLNSLLSKLSFGKADVISAAAFLLIHFPSWLSAGAASPAQLLSNAASVFLVGLLLGSLKKPEIYGGRFFFIPSITWA